MKKTHIIPAIITVAFLTPLFLRLWTSSITGFYFWISVLGIIAAFIVGVYFVDKIMGMTKPKTIENGIPAIATVLSCRQGNLKMTYGVTEVYRLILEVNVVNSMGETWSAAMKEMIPLTQIAVFQPGASFSVLYDPNDKTKLVFDQSSDTSQTGNSINVGGNGAINSQLVNEAKQNAPQDITFRLMAASALIKELSTSGVKTTATIISNNLLHAKYISDSDAYEFKLKVNAIDSEPFEANVTSLIITASVWKIETGKTLYVSYDRNNTHRVCITGLDKENSAIEL